MSPEIWICEYLANFIKLFLCVSYWNWNHISLGFMATKCPDLLMICRLLVEYLSVNKKDKIQIYCANHNKINIQSLIDHIVLDYRNHLCINFRLSDLIGKFPIKTVLKLQKNVKISNLKQESVWEFESMRLSHIYNFRPQRGRIKT